MMRFPKKAFVKLLPILVGASVGAIVYIAQNKSDEPYKRDRFSGDDLAESHLADLEHDVSFLGKEHQLDHLFNDFKEQRSRLQNLHPYITIAPNNTELSFRMNPKFKFSSCPYSLQGKLQESQWASQYYHPTIQMTMTDDNINQEEYERMKTYHMPFGFHYKNELTFDELSKTLKQFSNEESILGFGSNERPRCVSCAIVGNGGMLNGSGMGKEIDNHDMIFRVNHCIRRGYEHDVGTRTTHYVFMDRSLIHTQQADIPKDKGIKWIFLPCRINDYHYISEVAKGTNPKQKLKANAADIRLLHPDFVRYIHKIWMRTKSFRPSTGAMMFMTALHSGCDSLSVYGMGFNVKYTEHYYDKTFSVYKNVKGSHDFAREIEIMKELDKAGVIKWYKRDVPEFLS
ncbi:alpha-N-acetylgalactosaminide alpha-2,6-sialyltransferase 1-like [Lytechinus variegatus]|uniref:alpha-N-acetylgalactosaminide alpha-2,6-sialyltransferase 1-like n=1 Tax=Lytechinus variegatus TaxID=7654 RepID=UPI001BB1D297|nr:alpha-N-acetylgalactosaminide alpha-2,6-sialyltransferase 1-like [Lytechinus variegatus]XP_041459391.1 alpha-N-acetylgalactosaminide alpha-2,6-sialyltransferase 1-like [Lytechinus variegatus]XP_041459392.1 alpha-N-acetylgalactosaminide alpha-2,6-sialyltransferase 1-like [Lytechinus variegatus]